VLFLRLQKFVDSEGQVHWLDIRPPVAQLLAATEPRLKERLFRDPRQIDQRPGQGNAWEGPRLRFWRFLGESAVWSGPRSLSETVKQDGRPQPQCAFCHGAELPPRTYCLACDRCSSELSIPSAGIQSDRWLAVMARAKGLLGGCRGKR
jgi:hypothetical protein